jgi:hypothetical protein
MAYKLQNTQRGIPLDVDGQYELLGELMSARAKIRELYVRIERLERCREDLTNMVQDLTLKGPRKKNGAIIFTTNRPSPPAPLLRGRGERKENTKLTDRHRAGRTP